MLSTRPDTSARRRPGGSRSWLEFVAPLPLEMLVCPAGVPNRAIASDFVIEPSTSELGSGRSKFRPADAHAPASKARTTARNRAQVLAAQKRLVMDAPPT